VNATATARRKLRTGPRTVGILTTNHFSPDGNRVVYGGAERYALELSRLLVDLGFRVEWWQIGTGWQRELMPGVLVRSMPAPDAPYQTLPQLNQLFNERAVAYDLAIYFVVFLAYPSAVERSIAISHGIYWDYPGFDALNPTARDREEWLRRLWIALSGPRKIVSVDTAFIQWANATWPGLAHRFEYIPNFVDLEVFAPDGPDGAATEAGRRPVRILFPRRLTGVRGLNEMARAAEILTAARDDVEFHFVGRAHDDKLEKEVLEWALAHDRIYYYWKPPHEMPRVYRAMDIVVIPSRSSEGTALSCLEAMAAGKAVVASYAGGLPNLIIHGYNGILVRPTVENLVTVLDDLASRPDVRATLGARAREVATCFSLQVWRRRWTRLLEEVLGEPLEGSGITAELAPPPPAGT